MTVKVSIKFTAYKCPHTSGINTQNVAIKVCKRLVRE